MMCTRKYYSLICFRVTDQFSDRMHTDGYMSSPERGSRAQYEDPYYSQYATRSGSITPVIDEEARLVNIACCFCIF